MTVGYKTGYGGNNPPIELDQLFDFSVPGQAGLTGFIAGYDGAGQDLSTLLTPYSLGSDIGFDTGFIAQDGRDLRLWFAAAGSVSLSVITKGTFVVGQNGGNYGRVKYTYGAISPFGSYTPSEGKDIAILISPGAVNGTEWNAGTFLKIDAPGTLPDFVRIDYQWGGFGSYSHPRVTAIMPKYQVPGYSGADYQYYDVDNDLLNFDAFNGGSMGLEITKLEPSHTMAQGQGSTSGVSVIGYNDGFLGTPSFGTMYPSATLYPGGPFIRALCDYNVGLGSQNVRLYLSANLSPRVVDYIQVRDRRLIFSVGGLVLSPGALLQWPAPAVNDNLFTGFYPDPRIPIDVVMWDPAIASEFWMRPGRSPDTTQVGIGSSMTGGTLNMYRANNCTSIWCNVSSGSYSQMTFSGGNVPYVSAMIVRYRYNGIDRQYTLNLSASGGAYDANVTFADFSAMYANGQGVNFSVEPVYIPMGDNTMWPMNSNGNVGWSKNASYGFVKPAPPVIIGGVEILEVYTGPDGTLYITPSGEPGHYGAFTNLFLNGVNHAVGSFVYVPGGYDSETGQSWSAMWYKNGVGVLPERTVIGFQFT